MAMTGTEFARISGSYSTAYIGTYQVKSQSTANNSTTFTLRCYFYYGGSSSVSSSYSTFKLDGTTQKTGSYNYSNGYHLLGSKEITVTHNNDGSFPSKSIKIYADCYHMSGTKSGNITAPKINRLATVIYGEDFNDEGSPNIRVLNPANYQVAPYLNFYVGTTKVASIVKPKGRYPDYFQFPLTEEDRTIIRNALPNQIMCRVTEGVDTYDGNTKLGYNAVEQTFIIVNAYPTFTNFNYEDTNPKTLGLTENSEIIINGYSNVKASIPVEMKAVANKGATIVKYDYITGEIGTTTEQRKSITYSSSQEVFETINNVKGDILRVFAVDSRNNAIGSYKYLTDLNKFINYQNLEKGYMSVSRQTATSEQTTLSLSGVVDLVNFGSVTNSIKEVKYRYKQTDSNTWSNYIDITSSITTDQNGDYSYNGLIQGDTILGFDKENSYNIELSISDELSSITYTETLGSARPNIALHKDGISIMSEYDTNLGGVLQVKGKDIMSNLFFEAGDTYTYNSIIAGGVVTSSKTVLTFSIPLPKFAIGLKASITGGTIYARGIGGYLLNGTDITQATQTTITTGETYLTIALKYSAFSSATNNTPVNILINNLAIELSTPSS